MSKDPKITEFTEDRPNVYEFLIKMRTNVSESGGKLTSFKGKTSFHFNTGSKLMYLCFS